MFFGAWRVIQREESIPKMHQRRGHIRHILLAATKNIFQIDMVLIYIFECPQKIFAVGAIEGAMYKLPKRLQIVIRKIKYKIVRSHLHHLHQLPCIAGGYFALPPGQGSGKKTSDLNIFFTRKQVRHRNGISFDKRTRIILRRLLIEEDFEISQFFKIKLLLKIPRPEDLGYGSGLRNNIIIFLKQSSPGKLLRRGC